MSQIGIMWECACGQLERAEEAPEECADCGKLDQFMKVPEELIEEREKDLMEKEILAVPEGEY